MIIPDQETITLKQVKMEVLGLEHQLEECLERIRHQDQDNIRYHAKLQMYQGIHIQLEVKNSNMFDYFSNLNNIFKEV